MVRRLQEPTATAPPKTRSQGVKLLNGEVDSMEKQTRSNTWLMKIVRGLMMALLFVCLGLFGWFAISPSFMADADFKFPYITERSLVGKSKTELLSAVGKPDLNKPLLEYLHGNPEPGTQILYYSARTNPESYHSGASAVAIKIENGQVIDTYRVIRINWLIFLLATYGMTKVVDSLSIKKPKQAPAIA